MNPYILAVLTAAAWGIGGYFEKQGLHLGNLSPQMGITIRTATALVILAIFSFPEWKNIGAAGPKSVAYMVLGGGVVAGTAGMLCFYAAIKGAPLGRVMPIAFTSPFFGALMGMTLGGEAFTLRAIVGMLMTIGGVALLSFK